MGYPVNSDAIGVFMQRMRFRTPLAAIDQGATIATQDKVYRQVFVLVFSMLGQQELVIS